MMLLLRPSLSFSRKSIQNWCSALQAQIVEKSSSKMMLVHGNLTVPGVPICFQHFVISVTDEILQLGMHWLLTGTQGRQCVLRIEGKQERPCTNDVDISICSRHQAKINWLMILAVCRISFQDWRRTHVAWVAWRMLLKCRCLVLPGEICKGKKSKSAMSKSERRSKSFLAAQVLDVLD